MIRKMAPTIIQAKKKKDRALQRKVLVDRFKREEGRQSNSGV